MTSHPRAVCAAAITYCVFSTTRHGILAPSEIGDVGTELQPASRRAIAVSGCAGITRTSCPSNVSRVHPRGRFRLQRAQHSELRRSRRASAGPRAGRVGCYAELDGGDTPVLATVFWLEKLGKNKGKIVCEVALDSVAILEARAVGQGGLHVCGLETTNLIYLGC